jgi:hypothetical protein
VALGKFKMKINEVIQEGIWDDIKSGAKSLTQRGQNVLGNIGQTYKSIGPRYQANKALKQQQAANKYVISNAQQQYNQFAAQLGGTVTVPQALGWYQNFAGKKAETNLTDTSPLGIQRWLEKEVPLYVASKAQAELPPAPPPAAKMPAAVAPTQSAIAAKMPAPITPVATTQQAVADKMPVAAKTAKPKVPYSAVAQKAQAAKVSAPRNPGAPTDTEYNKFQDLLKQALDKQGA